MLGSTNKFLVTSVVVEFGLGQALKIVGYWMSYLLKNDTYTILGSIRVNLKRLVQILKNKH